MVPVALSDVIAVGEVPTSAEIEILAKAGFRAILNTQPDGEVARFPSAHEVGVEVGKTGMTYRHVPVLSRRPDEACIAAFAAALSELPRPVYACCYSGARTAAAWALAATRDHDVETIEAACRAAGFDIAFMRTSLVERRRAATNPAPAAPVTGAGDAAANGVATGTSAQTFIAKTDAGRAGEAAAVPLITPSVLMPRAATAGGFAVAG